MKTYSVKPAHITRKWYLINAEGAPLGRLATTVATLLLGKDKPMFSHHLDTGDYVIVINAKKIGVTGNKLQDKKYSRHSGFPGGLTQETLADKLTKNPSSVIEHAVRGMLPSNKLRDGRLARLKVYEDTEHAHEAQKPEVIVIRGKK